MHQIDYIQDEINLTKALFDLDEVLQFQQTHDVQIIRGEDYQYMCYIDKEVWGLGLTPMGALVNGIKQIKNENNLH